jgi:hypothetical protein
MSAERGSEQPPLPSALANVATFKCLLIAEGKKPAFAPPPKFVKKLNDVSVTALPPEQPMQSVVSLENRALVGQFVYLQPSPRTIKNWIQKN